MNQLKKFSTLRIATALLTSTCLGQARATEVPKKGLWERFCLDQNILDACGKASTSLEQQIENGHSEDQRTTLKERLNQVTQKSCTLKGHKGCPKDSKSDDS